MKKILYILTAAVLMLTSCEKEVTFPEKLYGDWHCSTTLSNDATTGEPVKVDIYVNFTAEGYFSLYQKIGQGGYKIFSGRYSLSAAEGGYILSGEYSDGTMWGATYTVTSTDMDTIMLTTGENTETYTRVTGVPDEVLASASPATKSADTAQMRFL